MSRIDIKNPYLDMQYTYDLADLRSVEREYEKGAEHNSIYDFLLLNKDRFEYALYMLNTAKLPFYRQNDYWVTYLVTPDEFLNDQMKEMITNLSKLEIVNLVKYNTISKALDLNYIQNMSVSYQPSLYRNETFFFSSNNGNFLVNNQARVHEQIRLPKATILIVDKVVFPSVFGI